MASESKTCEHINEEAIRDVQKFQLEYLKEEEYEDFYPLGARGISKPHSEIRQDLHKLAWCCQTGRLDLARDLIGRYEKADEREHLLDGWTNAGDIPLILASKCGHLEIVKLLLSLGADPRGTSSKELTALDAAAEYGHAEVVRLLLEAGAEHWMQERPRFDEQQPIERAATHGHEEVVEILKERERESERLCELDACTKMNHAIKRGNLEKLNEALSMIPDKEERKLLVQGKLSRASIYKAGTPLMNATQHLEIVKVLLQNGADPNFQGQEWDNAMLGPCASGRLDVVKALVLDGGADVDLWDSDYTTGLMFAAQEGHGDVARFLVDNGADVRHSDRSGRNAFLHAAFGHHFELAEYLKERGSNVNQVMRFGIPALVNAVQWKDLETVRFLIGSGGVDVNAKGQKGETALRTAKETGQEEIVRLLRDNGAME